MKRASLILLTGMSVALLGCASVKEIATEVAKDQADKVREDVNRRLDNVQIQVANEVEKKGEKFEEMAAKAKEEGDTTRWLVYSALGLGAAGGAGALKNATSKSTKDEKKG